MGKNKPVHTVYIQIDSGGNVLYRLLLFETLKPLNTNNNIFVSFCQKLQKHIYVLTMVTIQFYTVSFTVTSKFKNNVGIML